MRPSLTAPIVALAVALASCAPSSPTGDASPDPPDAARDPAPDAGSRAAAPATRVDPPFGEIVRALSEPGAAFLSNNLVSNETSYLQVAPDLARIARPGGAYLGVGPEQNFTYLAIARPELAFLVDVRRENLLLHLLYKAAFAEAATRSQFLALMIGRPWDAASDPGAEASIEAVVAHATRAPPDEAAFAAAHARLLARIERALGARPDTSDRGALEAAHRAFFKDGLDLRFELAASGRRYPRLGDLLAATDPEGRQAGFLASEAPFRFVQRLEREDRVIPVIGDFAGDRALPGVAAEIRRRGLTVSVFYVSNVEQYLFDPGVWTRWTRNVAALPTDEASLFVRAYLDQGRRHPAELPGHRTATVLQPIQAFLAHDNASRYRSFWSVATDAAPSSADAGAPGR